MASKESSIFTHFITIHLGRVLRTGLRSLNFLHFAKLNSNMKTSPFLIKVNCFIHKQWIVRRQEYNKASNPSFVKIFYTAARHTWNNRRRTKLLQSDDTHVRFWLSSLPCKKKGTARRDKCRVLWQLTEPFRCPSQSLVVSSRVVAVNASRAFRSWTLLFFIYDKLVLNLNFHRNSALVEFCTYSLYVCLNSSVYFYVQFIDFLATP